jgi:hypothetical protein
MLQDAVTFFKTVPKHLNWLTLVTFICLCVKQLVANRFPEVFPSAYELGVVFEGLLVSILASYIFYLVAIHTKEVRDRQFIAPHINKWGRLIVGDCVSQLAEISKASNIEVSLNNLTRDSIDAIMGQINPNGEAPMLIGDQGTQKATWRQYFEHYRLRSKRYITRIMSQLIFLDSRLVALVTKIDDSQHFLVVEATLPFPMGNQNASIFSEGFFEYCVMCKELNAYLDYAYSLN